MIQDERKPEPAAEEGSPVEVEVNEALKAGGNADPMEGKDKMAKKDDKKAKKAKKAK